MPGMFALPVGTGTSRPHLHDEVRVDHKTRAGMALRYTKPTYFNGSKFAVISDTSLIQRVEGSCPPGLFQEISALFEEQVKKAQASNKEA